MRHRSSGWTAAIIATLMIGGCYYKPDETIVWRNGSVDGSNASPSVAKDSVVTKPVSTEAKPLPPGRKPAPISEKRTALVIGNGVYRDFPVLRNSVNDARDIGRALEKLGFDVHVRENAGQREMEGAIAEFRDSLRTRKGVGLFYFAGHGVQVEGENFLIPIDAPGDVIESNVRYHSVRAQEIVNEMDAAGASLKVVMLDACRDNPLPKASRSATRGLASMEGARGTIISFATATGRVASDGTGRNGLYTKHFLRALEIPGLTAEAVFKEVLRGVEDEAVRSGSVQTPWWNSSYTGEFIFNPGDDSGDRTSAR